MGMRSINNPQRLPIPSLAPEVWYAALQHDISPRFIPTQEDSGRLNFFPVDVPDSIIHHNSYGNL